LAICLCSTPNGIVGTAVDVIDAEVCVAFGVNVGGRIGLQGECEPPDALDDVSGTPDDE